jgi:histidine triad (HIT) family protein
MLANKIVKNLGASGCNILTNAGEVAGQTVHHFHIHIIPRYDDKDTITIQFSDNSKTSDLDAIQKEILK